MEDDPKRPERTTSAAKEIDPDKLSRARSLKAEFDRAKAAHEHTSQEKERGITKGRRHAPAPKPQMRPTLPGTRAVDRQAFKENQTKEDKLARAQQLQQHLDRAKQRSVLDRNKDNDKDHER
jgi:hypothetical protein